MNFTEPARVCPHCAADLTTGAVREIGHEVPGVYDGVLYWSCPFCGWAWPRWTDGGRLTDLAARYAAEHNTRRTQ